MSDSILELPDSLNVLLTQLERQIQEIQVNGDQMIGVIKTIKDVNIRDTAIKYARKIILRRLTNSIEDWCGTFLEVVTDGNQDTRTGS